jgi:glutamine amidotransferase
MISIIDTGSGNIASIHNMLSYLNFSNKVTTDLDILDNSKILILPGVGTFDYVINQLQRNNIFEFLKNPKNLENKYLIGICVGMQLLFDESKEGNLKGLSLIGGNVKKFEKLHMGWNNIFFNNETKVSKNDFYYFAHNYYVECDKKNVLKYCNHTVKFPAIVKKKNIFGIQFHPEKSHVNGIDLFRNLITSLK